MVTPIQYIIGLGVLILLVLIIVKFKHLWNEASKVTKKP